MSTDQGRVATLPSKMPCDCVAVEGRAPHQNGCKKSVNGAAAASHQPHRKTYDEEAEGAEERHVNDLRFLFLLFFFGVDTLFVMTNKHGFVSTIGTNFKTSAVYVIGT